MLVTPERRPLVTDPHIEALVHQHEREQSVVLGGHGREPAGPVEKLEVHEQNRVPVDEFCISGSSPRWLSAIADS